MSQNEYNTRVKEIQQEKSLIKRKSVYCSCLKMGWLFFFGRKEVITQKTLQQVEKKHRKSGKRKEVQ